MKKLISVLAVCSSMSSLAVVAQSVSNLPLPQPGAASIDTSSSQGHLNDQLQSGTAPIEVEPPVLPNPNKGGALVSTPHGVKYTPYTIKQTDTPTDTSMDDVVVDKRTSLLPPDPNGQLSGTNTSQIAQDKPISLLPATIPSGDETYPAHPHTVPVVEINTVDNTMPVQPIANTTLSQVQPNTPTAGKIQAAIDKIAPDIDAEDVMLQKSDLGSAEFVLLTKVLMETVKMNMFFVEPYCQKSLSNKAQINTFQDHSLYRYNINNCLSTNQEVYSGLYQENSGNIYNAYLNILNDKQKYLINIPVLSVFDQHDLKTFEFKNGIVNFDTFKIYISTMTTSVVGTNNNYSIQASGIINYNNKNYYFKTTNPMKYDGVHFNSGNIHFLNNGRVMIGTNSFDVWNGDGSVVYQSKN